MDYSLATSSLRSYDEHTTKRVRSVHAEIDACSKLPDKLLRGASLFIVRVGLAGNLRGSTPCLACRKYIKKKGIARVFFS